MIQITNEIYCISFDTPIDWNKYCLSVNWIEFKIQIWYFNNEPLAFEIMTKKIQEWLWDNCTVLSARDKIFIYDEQKKINTINITLC